MKQVITQVYKILKHLFVRIVLALHLHVEFKCAETEESKDKEEL